MNPRQTYLLVTIAVLLAAFIYFFERHQPGAAERRLPPRLFPGLQARQIDALEVTFPDPGGVTRAEQQDGKWALTLPQYPARQTVLDNLGLTLEQLRKLEEIPAHELLVQGAKDFGFDPPTATLRIESDTNKHVLQIGATTPLTTNVYVRLANTGEIFVTDGRLLQALPGSTNAWRSPLLVDLDEIDFDHIQVRAGNRLLELEKNPTNSLWQITRPIPARADQSQVNTIFEGLRAARATEFVVDQAVSQLERFGLQSPALELSLLQRTNEVFQLEFGGSPTNAPGQIFVRRLDTTNVLLADKALADFLAQPYKAFHDPRLIPFDPETLDRIRVDSVEDFTLQRQPDQSWAIIEPIKQKADPVLMGYFLTNLLSLQILDFAKEVPSEQDLANLGILEPRASYGLFEQRKDSGGNLTNILFTEISFGKNPTADRIYVRRSDETPVYITKFADFYVLPSKIFELRHRQIFNFSPSNVISLTISTQQQTRVYSPDAQHRWSEDPIQNAAMEEALFRFGHAEAMGWVAKGAGGLTSHGINADSLGVRLKLNLAGREIEQELRFGTAYRGGFYTGAVLPGDDVPTVFLFPAHLLEQFLTYFPPP